MRASGEEFPDRPRDDQAGSSAPGPSESDRHDTQARETGEAGQANPPRPDRDTWEARDTRPAETPRETRNGRQTPAGRERPAPPRQPAPSRPKWPIPLALLGLLALTLAAILGWGVAPGRDQLPEDLNVTRELSGTANALLNQQALQAGDLGNALVTGVPITMQHTVRVLETSGSAARVEDERTLLTDGGQTLGSTSTTYAVDRRSLEPATNAPAGWEVAPHQGLTVSFPVDAQPHDYSVWVPDTQSTAPIRFVREESRGGVNTFVYEVDTEAAPIQDEAVLASLPATLSRAQLQGLVPSLPIPADQRALLMEALPALPDQVPVTYTHESGATYWVEPRTGIIIDMQQQVVRTGTVGGPGGAVLASMPVYNVDSRFTDGSVSAAARDANDRRNALNTVGSTWPWVLGTLGVLALVAGLLGMLARRRPQPRPVPPPSYRPTERTTATGRDLRGQAGEPTTTRPGQPQPPYVGQTPHTGPYRESGRGGPTGGQSTESSEPAEASQPGPELAREEESRRSQPGQPPGRQQPPAGAR